MLKWTLLATAVYGSFIVSKSEKNKYDKTGKPNFELTKPWTYWL